AAIGQWDCNNANSNQNWFLIPTATSGVYQLKNVFSGLCASFGTSNANGTGLVQQTCGGSRQAFKVNGISTGSGGGTITSPTASAMVSEPVTVAASATESVGIQQMQVWDNTTGQKLGYYCNCGASGAACNACSSTTMSLNVTYPAGTFGAGTHDIVV